MKTKYGLRRMNWTNPERHPLQAEFTMYRNDGNAGLWVHSIGGIASFNLSVPWGLLWARAELPWRKRKRPGHGTVVFGIREWFTFEFRVGRKPDAGS